MTAALTTPSRACAPAASTSADAPPTPVRVAIVPDHPIILAGLAAMLTEHRDRVLLVDPGAYVPGSPFVDVVLVDPQGPDADGHGRMSELIAGASEKVVVFSWCVTPAVIDLTIGSGAAGYLSKTVTAEELVSAVRAIHAGETVICVPEPGPGASQAPAPVRPARDPGLSRRETEVLSLIAQGLTNREIAQRMFVSINSLKTYIRTAYRKIGVSRRAQAVRWGMHLVEESGVEQREGLRSVGG